MTASESYWNHAAWGQFIPACVPLRHEGEHCGVASHALPFRHLDSAMDLVLSDDPRDRALAAIYACNTLYAGIEEQAPGVFEHV